MQRMVSIQGHDLWTEAVGSPSGPPVLLLSGAGAHAHFFSDTFCAPLIEVGFFVIRYDHRDTGLSDPSDKEYTIQDLVEDAIGLLDAYHLESAHVVGHSMGGYMGQIMALTHPKRMRTLTLISAGPAGETEALIKPQTQEEIEVLRQTWAILLRNRPTSYFEESYAGFLSVWERLNGKIPVEEGLARPYTEEMYTRSRYPVGAHQKHMRVMQKVAETLKERKEMFAQITLPVLILHGAEDYLVPVQRGGRALKERLPQADLQIIPQMGHMLFDYALEKQIADKLIHFLKEHS